LETEFGNYFTGPFLGIPGFALTKEPGTQKGFGLWELGFTPRFLGGRAKIPYWNFPFWLTQKTLVPGRF